MKKRADEPFIDEEKKSSDFLFRCVHAYLYQGLKEIKEIKEIDKKQHTIIGKVETLFLDCNNLQKNILKQNFKNKILKQNFKTIF